MRLITATVTDQATHTDSLTPVPWWSFTKTVLASAALALVAQGRLHLDAPVLDAPVLDAPIPHRPFTLRQLLQHRAGLRCYGTLRAYHDAVAVGQHPWPAEDMLQRANATTPAYQPGEGWAYSNIGYLHVRTLIEQADNAPLAEALDHLVLAPLGITGVTLAQHPEDLAATAWGNPDNYHPAWVYHGLLLGPAQAAATLLHRLLAGHLLPPDLLEAMQTPHPVGGPVPNRPWQTANYGLGLMIGEGDPPGQYTGHTGGGPSSTAAIYQRTTSTQSPPLTAAAFAPCDDPATAERRALALAHRS